METLRALIHGDLPPAGYPIATKKSEAPDYLFSRDYHTYWLDSGTSSLAVALLDCKLRHPEIEQPQVIIPGYCCPDLVSAAVYAGVEPLVVDIQQNDPAYDLNQLQAALSSRVIAIIAINFLGLRENLADIRRIIRDYSPHPVYLIEDNAQWFPDSDHYTFESDYVVFSFGRGKPLSLLGGGALLTKNDLHSSVNLADGANFSFTTRLKISAYNALLHPHLYCFLNRAPFLSLGETRYHPLTVVAKAPQVVDLLFSENFRLHQQRSLNTEKTYQESFQRFQALTVLYGERKNRLLRYPLLFKTTESCTKAYEKLLSAGLGASKLYQKSLNQIDGMTGKIQCVFDLPNACHFAARLLTLPVHAYVKDHHRKKIVDIVCADEC